MYPPRKHHFHQSCDSLNTGLYRAIAPFYLYWPCVLTKMVCIKRLPYPIYTDRVFFTTLVCIGKFPYSIFTDRVLLPALICIGLSPYCPILSPTYMCLSTLVCIGLLPYSITRLTTCSCQHWSLLGSHTILSPLTMCFSTLVCIGLSPCSISTNLCFSQHWSVSGSRPILSLPNINSLRSGLYWALALFYLYQQLQASTQPVWPATISLASSSQLDNQQHQWQRSTKSLSTARVFTTPIFSTKIILLSSYSHQQPTVDSTNNNGHQLLSASGYLVTAALSVVGARVIVGTHLLPRTSVDFSNAMVHSSPTFLHPKLHHHHEAHCR